MNAHTIGSKYEETKDQDIKEIAKLVRKDLRGHFGKEYRFSVRISRYSGGQSLDIQIKQVPAGLTINNPARVRDDLEHGWNYRPVHSIKTEEAYQLKSEIEGIAQAYNFDDSDSMTDYFHVRFYTHVGFDSDLNKADRDIIEATIKAEQDEEQDEQVQATPVLTVVSNDDSAHDSDTTEEPTQTRGRVIRRSYTRRSHRFSK